MVRTRSARPAQGGHFLPRRVPRPMSSGPRPTCAPDCHLEVISCPPSRSPWPCRSALPWKLRGERTFRFCSAVGTDFQPRQVPGRGPGAILVQHWAVAA